MSESNLAAEIGKVKKEADWSKGEPSAGGPLLPAVVQEATTGEVLMLGYVSAQSLEATADKGELVFFSRSRQELWHKGASSGNRLAVTGVGLDCDQDTFLFLVRPTGPVCHRGTFACFDDDTGSKPAHLRPLVLAIFETQARLDQRAGGTDPQSYSFKLLEAGLDRILKKVGEESAEVLLAAKNVAGGPAEENEPALRAFSEEVADLLFHLVVLHKSLGIPLEAGLRVLRERQGAVRRDGSLPKD